MRKTITGFLTVAVMAGCASTDTSGPSSQLEETVFTGFMPLAGGGERHAMSGLECPAMLGDMPFNNSKDFRGDGTDIACSHAGETGALHTVFLSQFPEMGLGEYFQWSLNDTGGVLQTRGYEIDQEATKTCNSASFDAASLLSSIMNMEDNVATVRSWETAVFKSDTAISIMTVDVATPGEFIKQRYTLPGKGVAQAKEACEQLRVWHVDYLQGIRTARGIDDPSVTAILNELEEPES